MKMQMKMSRTARTLVTAAVLALGATTLSSGVGVQAAPPTPLPSAAEAGAARHCTVDVRTRSQQCFTTFTQAVASATGGRVADAPADAAAVEADGGARRQLAAELQGDVVIGSVFQDADYGGASLTVYGDGLCPKDDTVNYALDLDDGWKNTISSVQAWGNCWLWLYPEPGLGGDRDGPFKENTPDIGSFMNDRAQSIGFS